MIDLIIGVAQIPCYILSWRFIFRKVTYWYVVKPRPVDNKGTSIQQFEPDWSDVLYGIVAATLLSFCWPLMMITKICLFVMSRYRPVQVAEALGGRMPPEARMALLEYKQKELEVSGHIIDQNLEKALRGDVV